LGKRKGVRGKSSAMSLNLNPEGKKVQLGRKPANSGRCKNRDWRQDTAFFQCGGEPMGQGWKRTQKRKYAPKAPGKEEKSAKSSMKISKLR